MAIPQQGPLDPSMNQYNIDLAQFEKDDWMMNPDNPNGYPAMWHNLMEKLKSLHGSPSAVNEAMRIIQFQLLGPTVIDGYEQTYGKVKGDLMNLTADVGTMENQISSILTAAKNENGLTPTQGQEFSNAMKNLYQIFNSQKSAGAKSQWLTKNGAQNGLSYVNGLYGALNFAGHAGKTIPTSVADQMVSWWAINPKNPGVPNPDLKIFQDNLQSLSGVNNSINQASSTEESLNNANMNQMEAVLKAIYTALTTFENKVNQDISAKSN